MEIVEKRASSGLKEDPKPVVIWGSVEGFIPSHGRILVKRLPPPEEGLIARPEIAQEQAERGYVVAVNPMDSAENQYLPPLDSVVTFSRYVEEKQFDDQGSDRYVLPFLEDIRGWHRA